MLPYPTVPISIFLHTYGAYGRLVNFIRNRYAHFRAFIGYYGGIQQPACQTNSLHCQPGIKNVTDLKILKENIENGGFSDAQGMDFKIYRGNLKLGNKCF